MQYFPAPSGWQDIELIHEDFEFYPEAKKAFA